MPNYSKEQLWELYKNLPKDLQKAASSEENARNIHEICTKAGVTDEDAIFDVAKNTGYVFLGLLPPSEFSYILGKELELEKNKAELVASEITRFVFLPVRKSLEALYKMEIRPSIKPGATPPTPEIPPPAKEKPTKRDIYREPTE